MPVAVPSPSASTPSKRRFGSTSGSASGSRSVSLSGSVKAKTQQGSTTRSTSASSSTPQVIAHSRPDSPPVKGILLVNNDRLQSDSAAAGNDADLEQDKTDSSSSPSSYLKPLLKYLPRHIDPSTIARLLKNVHPSAFGAYRTKEAWRREHPEVLNTAHHLNRQAREEQAMLDVESSHAVLPHSSTDDVCLAHSPPSATFSSSEDDDLDDEFAHYRLDGEENEYEQQEAKELDDYFNDEFDADLGTSPESASSLRDLASRRDSLDSPIKRNTTSPSSVERARASSQDSNATTATARNDHVDHHTSPSSPSKTATFLEQAAASLLSSTSPLAIYLSKPDEEHDSPLAGPSQRISSLQTETHQHQSDSTDQLNDDSTDTIPVPSSRHQQRDAPSPIASTSAAILYPDFRRRDSVELPRTPPSPSVSSFSPSPSASPAPSPSISGYTSSLSPRRSSSSTRSPGTTSRNDSTSQSRSQHYPTIPIPRIVKRQRSSSSLASSVCTCRSNASQVSNISTSSRSSSVKFAPLPEEEIAKARRESRNRRGGEENEKSRVMGIKGRRNLLLGIGVDDSNPPPANSTGASGSSLERADSRHTSATRDASYRRPVLDESDENDLDDGDNDDASSTTSSRDEDDRDRFDALAYFGEEDLLNPPHPSRHHLKKDTSAVGDVESTEAMKKKYEKKKRQGSDVTIRYGKNGELVERRPLGVTLEELTLPMKRVKETRGRSRQTNDLSASFSASKMTSPMNSPPTSPQLQRYTASQQSPSSSSSYTNGNSITSPPVSPSRMRRDDAPSSVMIGTQSPPDASHEKTPMPTPKLEKKMELSLTSSLPPSSEKPSSSASGELQPENISTSGTSPTSSSHSNGPSSGGSNDITPIPTPRAGSPIAGLKMTTSIFEQHQKSSKDFQLVDTFTTRATASTSGRTQNLQKKEEESIKVPPVLNVLALGGLLDDAATKLEAGSMNASVKSDKTSKAGFTADTEIAESNDVHSSESHTKPEQSSSEEEISSSTDGQEEGSDYDKTPTLHASLELPKLNETTRALHARYKKKRTVGIPHVTAKKKPITPSRKSKKA